MFLSPSLSPAAEVAKKIHEQLNEAHQPLCPWKSNPLPQNVLLTLVLQTSDREIVKTAHQELLAVGDLLPAICPNQNELLVWNLSFSEETEEVKKINSQ